jgi:hypothetical protein
MQNNYVKIDFDSPMQFLEYMNIFTLLCNDRLNTECSNIINHIMFSYVIPILRMSGRGFLGYYNDEPCVFYEDYYNMLNIVCVSPIYYYPFAKMLNNIDSQSNPIKTNYPIVFRNGITNSKQYIRNEFQSSFMSKIFGKKSTEVKWNVVFGKESEIINDINPLCFRHQCDSILSKVNHPIDIFTANNLVNSWKVDYTNNDNMGAVYATYENEVICAMKLIKTLDCICCGDIVFIHDDKFKSYSLALTSHIQVIKYMIDNKFECVDLGLNLSELGNYKKNIKYTEVPIFTPSIQLGL